MTRRKIVGSDGAHPADDSEQLELQDELDAQKGLDGWIESLPCPPWGEDEAA